MLITPGGIVRELTVDCRKITAGPGRQPGGWWSLALRARHFHLIGMLDLPNQASSPSGRDGTARHGTSTSTMLSRSLEPVSTERMGWFFHASQALAHECRRRRPTGPNRWAAI